MIFGYLNYLVTKMLKRRMENGNKIAKQADNGSIPTDHWDEKTFEDKKMHMNNIFQGKDFDGNWHAGSLTILHCYLCSLERGEPLKKGHYISSELGVPFAYYVRPETVRQGVRLPDRFGNEMFDGDITELEVEGEKRRFVVRIGTVVRDIECDPPFSEEIERASITGVYFEWEGKKLFPLVDKHDVPDNERMVIIGNVWDNPELLQDI
ncbi:hypothetical protein [Paenibacillus sp. Leaf72]|uniref:hypothetical protein n=1 Tax=Paenibacillus sp. Leaf72 TaxID=1736234 RepID=UPI0006FA9541|nr:hypothetical protein [Paenibacillus sp. Leaf72]KQN96969.1 hypothetical protein ASF12_23155 [Paenibacillus sp. Leaf72]